MITLKDILYGVPIESTKGNTQIAITNLHFDSRKVELNDVFVAIKGTEVDGHKFIEKAVNQGAIAVVCEVFPEQIQGGVTYIQVADSKKALAIIANNYYDSPSKKIKLIGVTGTNGKTTVSSLLYQMFKNAGYAVGLISTIKIMVDEEEYSTKLTTPDSITINKHLAAMVDAGVNYCFMEVSSHGIAQHRTAGLHFAGGIFTNLSHDHLDYHKTFAEYRDVKKQFFDELDKSAFAITNIDDKNGLFMLQNTPAKKYTYALKTLADYKVQILENEFTGLLLKLNNQEVWTTLIGAFNAYNIAAIFAAADLLDLPVLENLKQISKLKAVNGRFQYVVSPKQKVTAIVDYAHTPDALKNVLQTINSIRSKNENLITVVGCGGDRDKTKRPVMAQVATASSNRVIFTSDNPRTEDPDTIIEEMQVGVEPQNIGKCLAITQRKEAIKTACVLAQDGDIILIAGKGHETYQEINGVRTDFDDLKVVQEFLIQLKK